MHGRQDLGPHLAQVQAFLDGTAREWERELRIVHKDGSDRWHLTRGVAARDASGRATRVTGASIDITDRKVSDRALHEGSRLSPARKPTSPSSNKSRAILSRAREAAEAGNRAKDEFLANVSHEIRTPMNAILGMTELAIDSAPNDHQRQLLSTARSAAKNLLAIIEDLLDFSKIEAGKLALDRSHFSLRVAVADTLRALDVSAQDKGLELLCPVGQDVPDALEGDAGRLRQVLMNLIGNAIKCTPRGEVAVEVELEPCADAQMLPLSIPGPPWIGCSIAGRRQSSHRSARSAGSSTPGRSCAPSAARHRSSNGCASCFGRACPSRCAGCARR